MVLGVELSLNAKVWRAHLDHFSVVCASKKCTSFKVTLVVLRSDYSGIQSNTQGTRMHNFIDLLLRRAINIYVLIVLATF